LLNEIHGAWFDPSNPVVQFGGNLRHDLFQWMLEIEEKTDMCLCLGTSLSGMNADRVANTPAKRANKKQQGYLGTVIINIQQTPLDAKSTIRVWAKLDDAFQILALKLGFTEIKPFPIIIPDGDVFIVPYNQQGKLDHSCKMILDLRKGSEIIIAVSGAMNEGVNGKVQGKRDENYSIYLQENDGTCSRLFGRWWIESAISGKIPQLPIVNRNPKMKQEAVEQTEDMVVIEPTLKELPNSFNIVQLHKIVSDHESGENTHLWGLSLDSAAKGVVESVVWTLHSTFRDPDVQCNDFPFSIRRRGWGVFKVKVTITLKPHPQFLESQRIIQTSHKLDFSDEGEEAFFTQVFLPSKY